MTASLDATHDASRRSFVARANADDCDFPLQNLPFGIFSIGSGSARGGVAIGDCIFDLAAASASGLFEGLAAEAAAAAHGPDLNALLALGRPAAQALRARLFELLAEGGARQAEVEPLLAPIAAADLHLPVRLRSFTDMCASTFHIGRRRGTDAHGQPICPPMFRTIPVGYDGRASSVVISGTPVRRPNGNWQRVPDEGDPEFGPEPRLDYELELGLWIGGAGNDFGRPVAMREAADYVWGYSLVNDWSARGIQFWETMLGPFLGKSIATTVSPWIVTADALTPYSAPAFVRPPCDPPVPPHLDDPADRQVGGLDLAMEAWLDVPGLADPVRLTRTNFRHMYWTAAQMIAHHASNGCALAAGDLIGSGTCSGPEPEAAACLAEALLAGPFRLPDGRAHGWLEDGETVRLRARAERAGFRAIGFGEARGTVLPALDWNSI